MRRFFTDAEVLAQVDRVPRTTREIFNKLEPRWDERYTTSQGFDRFVKVNGAAAKRKTHLLHVLEHAASKGVVRRSTHRCGRGYEHYWWRS